MMKRYTNLRLLYFTDIVASVSETAFLPAGLSK